MTTQTLFCPICNTPGPRLRYQIRPADFFYPYVYTVTHLGPKPPDNFKVRECRQCGHWFVHPRLSKEELLACYPAERFTDGVGYHPFNTVFRGQPQIPRRRNSGPETVETWRQRAHRLEELATIHRSVLDFGCADGAFLRAIPSHWQRTGLDNNTGAIALARAISPKEIEFVCEDLATWCHGERRFGVITAFDVYEHVEDPDETTESLARLMEPGSLLWIRTPCTESAGARAFGSRWALLTPAVHLHYFSRCSIRTILERHGFEIIEQKLPALQLVYAARLASRFFWRRLFVAILVRYGVVSNVIHAVLEKAGRLDDRATFLRKLANINAAESLLPRLDDEISIIARFKGSPV